MQSEIERMERELKERLALEISLEPIGDRRFAVISPFTFDDGDRFPIVLGSSNGVWRLSDEGGVAMHLSYLDVSFETGNRARLVENIVRRHSVHLSEDWVLSKDLAGEVDADSLMSFIHAIAQVADIDFLAREVVESTFQEDFRSFLSRSIDPDRLTFGFFDKVRDPDGTYKADAAVEINGTRLFGFGVSSDVRAKDATITLLTYEGWYGPVETFVVFEDQTLLGRKPLAQLTNVVGKQFAALAGQEQRIRNYFEHLNVPLLPAGDR